MKNKTTDIKIVKQFIEKMESESVNLTVFLQDQLSNFNDITHMDGIKNLPNQNFAKTFVFWKDGLPYRVTVENRLNKELLR
jgi:hypothetical protein